MSILDTALEMAKKAPPMSEKTKRTLEKLVEGGRNMTGADRLEQKRYTLYGSMNPDPETKERIDRYMKRYYNV